MLQIDFEPRLESFWRVGGFYNTENDRKLRNEKKVDSSMIEDNVDRFFVYYGKPILQLRSRQPLPVLPSIEMKSVDSQISIDEASSEILKIGSSEEKTEGKLKEYFVGSDPDNTNLMIRKEVEIIDESNVFYPLQEYRYSPDLYLGIPRERSRAVIAPGEGTYYVFI